MKVMFFFIIVHTTEHVDLIHLLPYFSLEDIFARECHPPISHKLCDFLVLMEIFRMTMILRIQGEFIVISNSS